MRDVCALVVSYNSARVLAECLKHLKREGFEVIVVDNASSDQSVSIALENGAQVIQNPRNEGFGRAMNIGARHAQTPWIMPINPDAWLEVGFSAAMESARTQYPDAAFFAPRIVEEDGRHFYAHNDWLSPYLKNNVRAKWVIDGDCCVPSVSGACMLLRRDDFLRLGGFDEQLFLFYEDNDLCRKFAQDGHCAHFVSDAVVLHGRGQSSPPSAEGTYVVRWHMAWSKHYVEAKYGLPCTAKANIMLLQKKLFWAHLIFQKHKVLRYRAGIAGSKAWASGKSALEQQGLN